MVTRSLLRRSLPALMAGLVLAVSPSPTRAGDGVRIESVEVTGDHVRVRLRNDSSDGSQPTSIALSIRAGGFLIGASLHAVPPLAGASRVEVELPLPLWAAEHRRLVSRVAAEGCCTTEIVLQSTGESARVAHELVLPPAASGLPGLTSD